MLDFTKPRHFAVKHVAKDDDGETLVSLTLGIFDNDALAIMFMQAYIASAPHCRGNVELCTFIPKAPQ
jgi:hypothetical protein